MKLNNVLKLAVTGMALATCVMANAGPQYKKDVIAGTVRVGGQMCQKVLHLLYSDASMAVLIGSSFTYENCYYIDPTGNPIGPIGNIGKPGYDGLGGPKGNILDPNRNDISGRAGSR